MMDTSSLLFRATLLLSFGMFALALVLPVYYDLFFGPTPGWLTVVASAASCLQPSTLLQPSAFFTVPQKLLFSVGWLFVCVSIAAFVLLAGRGRRPFCSVLQIALGASLIYVALIPVVFPHASLHIGYFMWVSSLLLLSALSFSAAHRHPGHEVAV